MPQRRPGIPSIDSSIPKNIADVLNPIKEHVEISQGMRPKGTSGIGYPGWKRRSVTLEMLISVGVITEAQARTMFDME